VSAASARQATRAPGGTVPRELMLYKLKAPFVFCDTVQYKTNLILGVFLVPNGNLEALTGYKKPNFVLTKFGVFL